MHVYIRQQLIILVQPYDVVWDKKDNTKDNIINFLHNRNLFKLMMINTRLHLHNFGDVLVPVVSG